MDLENEMRAFSRSERPLRHLRADIQLEVQLRQGEQLWQVVAKDLSLGGLGIFIPADQDVPSADVPATIEIQFEEGNLDSKVCLTARLIWVRPDDAGSVAGFEFESPAANEMACLERYLLNQIILRNIEDPD